jgi:phage-related holin
VLATFVGLGSASLLAMIAYVFGGFQYPSAAYITALTVNFFTTAFGFWVALDFIITQQTDITKESR